MHPRKGPLLEISFALNSIAYGCLKALSDSHSQMALALAYSAVNVKTDALMGQ